MILYVCKDEGNTMKCKKIKKPTEKEKVLDRLKTQRKISRELQLESGIRHKAVVFKNKKKYDRKNFKKVDYY